MSDIKIEPNNSNHLDIIVKVCRNHGVRSLELTTKHIALMADCIDEYISQQPPSPSSARVSMIQLSSEENAIMDETFDRVVKRRSGKEGSAQPIGMDELWDEHSEYIEDNIDDLTRWAGSTVMDKKSFEKAISKLAAQPNKEDAVDLIAWSFGNIRAWNKSTGEVVLNDGTNCAATDLYDLYKQSK